MRGELWQNANERAGEGAGAGFLPDAISITPAGGAGVCLDGVDDFAQGAIGIHDADVGHVEDHDVCGVEGVGD